MKIMLEDQTNAELPLPSADIPARAMRPAADDHPMTDMEWNDLIDRIEDHDVVPVLGRALSQIASPDGPVKLYDDLLAQNVKALNFGRDRPVQSIASYEELFAARQALGE